MFIVVSCLTDVIGTDDDDGSDVPSTVPLSKGLDAVVDTEIVVVTFAQHRAIVSELAGTVTLLVRQPYTTSQPTM